MVDCAGCLDRDVVFHIWSELKVAPYRGVPIHSILVDETQDFTQAELRLLIHVCKDKNDMVCSSRAPRSVVDGAVAFMLL